MSLRLTHLFVFPQGYSALHGNVDVHEGVPVVAPRLNLWGEDGAGDEVPYP